MSESVAETKEIVVAIDDSLPSRSAAAAAIQIAASLNQTIRGVYIVDESLLFNPYSNYQAELETAVPTPGGDLLTSFKAQGEIALQELITACQKAQVPVSSQILVDDLVEWARQNSHQATLLALGRRGQGHEDESSHLGKHFRAIARHVRSPMLVGGDVQSPIKHLLLAYNGGPRSQQALQWAARLQHEMSAQVTVLFVCEDEKTDQTKRWQQEIQANLDTKDWKSYQMLHRQGRAAAKIAAAVDELGVDMALMGGYQHSMPLVEWLVGSTLDRVLRATAIPVLVA